MRWDVALVQLYARSIVRNLGEHSQPGAASLARMRVLVVIASSARRGAEIEGTGLAEELRRRDAEVECLALEPGSNPPTNLRVPEAASRAKSLSSVRAVRKKARWSDVVVACGSSTLPVSACATVGLGVPVVYRSIGDPRRWARGRVHRTRTAVFLRRMSHVVTLWDEASTAFRDLYRVGARALTVIPNARPASWFSSAGEIDAELERSRLGLSSEASVVVLVGALSREKRVDRAIEAVAEMAATSLVIAGAGPIERELRALADDRLPGRHRFVGTVDDIRKVLAIADVLVITSETEGMPGAAIEAGMAGVPVVATDVGAMRWLFDKGLRGELVEPEATPSSIAAALRRTIKSRVIGPALGELDWSVVGDTWSRLLVAIAGEVVERRR